MPGWKVQSSPVERVVVDTYDGMMAVKLRDVPMESDEAMEKSETDMRIFGWKAY